MYVCVCVSSIADVICKNDISNIDLGDHMRKGDIFIRTYLVKNPIMKILVWSQEINQYTNNSENSGKRENMLLK